jgi:hypothetical protein
MGLLGSLFKVDGRAVGPALSRGKAQEVAAWLEQSWSELSPILSQGAL